MWMVTAGLVMIWLVLKFVLHKGGYVHMFLVLGICFFVVNLIANRNARFHRIGSKGNGSA